MVGGLIDIGENDNKRGVQLIEGFILPTSVTSWLGPNSHKICEHPNSLAFSLGKMPEVTINERMMVVRVGGERVCYKNIQMSELLLASEEEERTGAHRSPGP